MDFAINKKTNQMVSAFEIFKNGSYQNLTKGEWNAPMDSLINIEELKEKNIKEVPVHYVRHKEFKNYRGTFVWVSPCFSLNKNSPGKTSGEGRVHKLIKNWLFTRLKEDDLFIRYSKGTKPHRYDNKVKLSSLDINWNEYEMEVTTSGTKKLRADILLPFHNKDNILGSGIFFEIQLSKQSSKVTNNRSINRALHGYSTVWIFEKDIEINDIENGVLLLKENIVKVNSFSEQIHFAKKGFIGKLKITVEEQCQLLDNKYYEIKYKTKKLLDKIQNNYSDLIDDQDKSYNEFKNKYNKKEEEILYKISNIKDNPFDEVVNNIFKKIKEKEKQLEENYEHPKSLGICNKCGNGIMIKKKGAYGFFYGCSSYKSNGGCKNTIRI